MTRMMLVVSFIVLSFQASTVEAARGRFFRLQRNCNTSTPCKVVTSVVQNCVVESTPVVQNCVVESTPVVQNYVVESTPHPIMNVVSGIVSRIPIIGCEKCKEKDGNCNTAHVGDYVPMLKISQ